jgi:hypothetical protein
MAILSKWKAMTRITVRSRLEFSRSAHLLEMKFD